MRKSTIFGKTIFDLGMFSRTCTRLYRCGRSGLCTPSLLKRTISSGIGLRFESTDSSTVDDFSESQEVVQPPSRPHWRQEVVLPDYAAKHVRRACKKYLHRDREQQWKEFLSAIPLIFRYLRVVRSRYAQKDFVDWGEGSISTENAMDPIVYDELTSVVYSEYRIAKKYRF